MGRVDPRRVGQGEQPGPQRPVQLPGQRLGGQVGARRGEEVGAADVSHEEGVSGEHPVGDGVVEVLPDQETDRLRRMARRGQHLQAHLAEGEALAVGQRLEGEADVCARAVADHRAGAVGQLQVAGEEVGVDVGLDDPLDRHVPLGDLLQVDVDVATRVDHDCPAGGLVADQVGGVREAGQVVLGEDHGSGDLLGVEVGQEAGQVVGLLHVVPAPPVDGVEQHMGDQEHARRPGLLPAQAAERIGQVSPIWVGGRCGCRAWAPSTSRKGPSRHHCLPTRR